MYARIITILILSLVAEVSFACSTCLRYNVNDIIALHRTPDSLPFNISTYATTHNPPNNLYTTNVGYRNMSSSHMFDVHINGRGRGSVNVLMILEYDLHNTCHLYIHDSAELALPELYLDSRNCSKNFSVAPLMGVSGYYLLQVTYFKNGVR